MTKTSWESKQSLRVVHLLLTSYQNSYGKKLLDSSKSLYSVKNAGAILFNIKNPVMAHDNAKDPCLNYANDAALKLWNMGWNEMIGMPSRLTTPKKEQEQRNKALSQATKTQAIKNYQGIRVNSKGELFIIKNARIWTILDEQGNIFGQGATFNCWWKIYKNN